MRFSLNGLETHNFITVPYCTIVLRISFEFGVTSYKFWLALRAGLILYKDRISQLITGNLQLTTDPNRNLQLVTYN